MLQFYKNILINDLSTSIRVRQLAYVAYAPLISLAYAWLWTHIRWHACPFFSYDCWKLSYFSGSYNFILFKNPLLHIWPLIYLFVVGRDIFFTAYIYFKEISFFSFHLNYLINISPYHKALAHLECPEENKLKYLWVNSYAYVHHFHNFII